jgi:L-threonylcarbamoyladenylate synthase
MQTKILPADQPNAIHHAIDVLRHGGLVAFPTDTVYGLASLPTEEEMLERLYIVKGRTHTKAVAVLLGSQSELTKVSKSPGKVAEKLSQLFWPGPLTIIVPRHPDLPEIISPDPTIGVRVPNHPIALKLLKLTGPLAVTSANLSGRENTTSAEEVQYQLEGRVHLILDGGQSPGGVPSTVVDCTTPELKILRNGPISMDQLIQALDKSE